MSKGTKTKKKPPTTLSALKADHELVIGPQVQVAYQLTKSSGLRLIELEFGELYEPVDRDDDLVSATSYKSKGTKTYPAYLNNLGQLKVRVYVQGQKGHYWNMVVIVNGKQIAAPQPKRTLDEDGVNVYEIAHTL